MFQWVIWIKFSNSPLKSWQNTEKINKFSVKQFFLGGYFWFGRTFVHIIQLSSSALNNINSLFKWSTKKARNLYRFSFRLDRPLRVCSTRWTLFFPSHIIFRTKPTQRKGFPRSTLKSIWLFSGLSYPNVSVQNSWGMLQFRVCIRYTREIVTLD